MWTDSYSKTYPGISKEAVWALWADVNHWPTWDHELEYCRMEGGFTVGNQFILKPKGAPAVKITLSEIKPLQRWVSSTKFPGARMDDIHEVTETVEGLRLTHTVEVSGLLSFVWVKLVAKGLVKGLPKQLDTLTELARKSHG